MVWRRELAAALEREFASRPRTATLATVDGEGCPRARTVVCREVTEAGELYVVSDARSEKNGHVRGDPRAEMVFWLPTLREQYRVLGVAGIEGAGGEEARGVWSQLSDAARALFLWPEPKGPRVQDVERFPATIPVTVEPPENYELIVLRPTLVEHLDLNPHPHLRRLWTEGNGGWAVVNP